MTSLLPSVARIKPVLQKKAVAAVSRALSTRTPPSRYCTYMNTRPAPSPSIEPEIKRRRLSTYIHQPNMERRARPVNQGSADRAKITLNAVELRLRNLLIDVASFIKENPVSAKEDGEGTPVPSDIAAEPLTLRFTGGWVRDKLLGVESHDIDVALSNMTGYQFGLRLKEYLEDDDHVTKHGLQDDPKKAGSLAKIAANPEKSKHLETVTTRIMGLDIDLVNLRKETYTEDSRNPAMEFGTPREDADRRDATINAMFYNLNDSVVEDLTEKGLDDLDKGIIRTPLSPLETFRDDPLRVLRLVRFASRLGYIIEDEALQAMRKAEIKSALVHKITKERIWVELEKMLHGPDPRSALSYIDNLGLYTTIFCDIVTKGEWQPQTTNWAKTCDTLERLLSKDFTEQSGVASIAVTDADSRFMAWMISGFIPWTDAPEMPPQKSGKPSPPLASLVAREGLKAPNKLSDLLTLCVRHLEEVSNWSTATSFPRDKLGMAIKNWGPTWKLQVLYTMLYKINENPEDEERIIARFDKLVGKIRELDLLEAHDLRPLLDGKQLSAALKLPPGPWMKAALDVVLAWQLRNPDITDTAEALKEVESSGVLTAQATSPEPERKGKGQKNKQGNAQKPAKGELASALITHFLRETLRPLFSQAKNPELTTAGRRKIDSSTPRKVDSSDFDDREKLWKQQKTLVFGLLGWVCHHLNHETITAEWGFLIPPLLTLVDDTDVLYRAEGAKLLGVLLQNTPPALLARTGLAPVFEQLLITNLSFLPSLTPEAETILIYNATIPTLIILANCLGTAAKGQPKELKVELLDRVVRKGLLHAHKFCGENVRISEMVLTHLPSVLNASGIESVKFLKDLLPMLSNILSDPFGTAYPPLLEKAATALKTTIMMTWPRACFWRTEILRGVTICWLRIAEDEGDSLRLAEVKAGLIDVVGVLTVACAKTGELSDLRNDAKLLVEADKRLETLLDVVIAED